MIRLNIFIIKAVKHRDLCGQDFFFTASPSVVIVRSNTMEGNLIVVLLSSLLLTNTVKDQNEFIKYGGFVVAIACLCITFLNGG